MTSDDEDTVIIAKNSESARVYHTVKCHRYPNTPREITIGEANRRGLRQCKECTGDVERGNATGTPLAEKLDEMNADDL